MRKPPNKELDEKQAEQLYAEIFRDYRGKGWTRWEGHHVTPGDIQEGGTGKVGHKKEKNGRWKGGRIWQGPYIRVMMANHPRATTGGYIAEQILMAEPKIGRFLKWTESVHHDNEIKSDNTPDNLIVCASEAEHQHIHRRRRALKACGHSEWLKCKYCREYGDPAKMRVRIYRGETWATHFRGGCLDLAP